MSEWPEGPTREDCEQAIGRRGHFLQVMYAKHLDEGDRELWFLLAKLGQFLVQQEQFTTMYAEANAAKGVEW